MSIRSTQRNTSVPSWSVSERWTAKRAISTAAASWSNPRAMAWCPVWASAQLEQESVNNINIIIDIISMLKTKTVKTVIYQVITVFFLLVYKMHFSSRENSKNLALPTNHIFNYLITKTSTKMSYSIHLHFQMLHPFQECPPRQAMAEEIPSLSIHTLPPY